MKSNSAATKKANADKWKPDLERFYKGESVEYVLPQQKSDLFTPAKARLKKVLQAAHYLREESRQFDDQGLITNEGFGKYVSILKVLYFTVGPTANMLRWYRGTGF